MLSGFLEGHTPCDYRNAKLQLTSQLPVLRAPAGVCARFGGETRVAVFLAGYQEEGLLCEGRGGGLVQNEMINVDGMRAGQRIEKVFNLLCAAYPQVERFELRLWWALEECDTFSKMDQVNLAAGCAYRDPAHPERPPLRRSDSPYGKRAVHADERVETTVNSDVQTVAAEKSAAGGE